MPPSEKCSSADVVKAAIQVIEKEGIGALTARRVATEAGVSTAPVYRNFESMEALAAEAMKGVRDRLLAYTTAEYTPVPFLNMGTGIALFAKEHPRLYQALFLETDRFEEVVKGFLEVLTENMKLDPRFTSLERKHRLRLLDMMWTYTHGLASLIAVGLARESSREAIIRSLQTVGQSIIRQHLEAAD
jgi:AcrR family transcriptional regulator